MTAMARRLSTDKKFILYCIAAAVLLIAVVAVLAPARDEDDPTPSTYNAGPQGAKAAFLLLPRLGYHVERSPDAISLLAGRDAARTTLVIATPFGGQNDAETHALEDFLHRGGRILATGDYGADVLPGMFWRSYAESPSTGQCRTTPDGDSELARAGPVTFKLGLLARTDLAETHVAQRCEGAAAVIWYRMGAGTAVWWAGDGPLTNRGLHTDANLQLLLASIGPADRTILFDESDHPWQPASPWSKTAGIPIASMVAQVLLAFAFALLAFSRRHGPTRTLQTTPRTSPLEFAESMGALYHRAGAGEAATQQARRGLLQVLQQTCGLPLDVVRGHGAGIATALEERYGFRDPELASLLESSEDTSRISPSRALTMVQSLHRVTDQLQRRFRRSRWNAAQEKARG